MKVGDGTSFAKHSTYNIGVQPNLHARKNKRLDLIKTMAESKKNQKLHAQLKR
jgi:hypothetical protein